MKGARAVPDVVAMLLAVRRSFGVGLVVLGLVAGRVAARQQVPPPPAPTTGAISGVVMDGATGKPIGGATVSFWSFDTHDPRSYAQSMLTDAKGRFVFLRLPRTDGCNLYVSKSGYADGGLDPRFSFGTAAMALKESEWVPNVTLTLWRNGGISGRVVDEASEPAVGIPVRALRVILVSGMPHVDAGPIGTTDDRGIYRIGSLPPGKYLVMVPSVQSSAPASTSARTLAGRRTDAAPNEPPLTNGAGLNLGHDRLVIGNYATPPPATDRLMAYPTVFYPGARALTSATPIDLAPGQEKGGVDFALQPVPVVRVSGTVISSGALDPNFVLRLLPRGSENLGVGSEQATALVSASGAFTFLGVPSGSYTIDAGLSVTQFSTVGVNGLPLTPGMRVPESRPVSVSSAPDDVVLFVRRADVIDREWAALPIDVGADDVTGLSVTLRPTATVSGEIVWDGPPGPRFPYVDIEPAAGDARLFPTPPSGFPPTKQLFSVAGLGAGEYVIRPHLAGTTVVRIVANGHDVTTRTIDTSSGDISGVVVTVTTKATRISGSVRDVTGPGQQTSVIAFPIEKRQWSRYGLTPLTIKATTFLGPRYTLSGLPPGEYFVVAVERGIRRCVARSRLARRGLARRDASDAQVGRARHGRSVAVAGGGEMTARVLSMCVVGALVLAPSVTGRSAELARIAGVVVTTDATPQPVRRAIVALSGGPLALSLNAITDDEGRFEITDVPAGRFTISASRASYVTIAYGASAPGRVGVPLVVEAGQRLTGIRLLLARGAAIAGTVRDSRRRTHAGRAHEAGEAQRNGSRDAAALRLKPTIAEAIASSGWLPVSTSSSRGHRTSDAAGQLQVASSDEIDRALQELARGGRGGGDLRQPPPMAASERSVAMTPVWYPSATSSEDATPISLQTGEERTGTDITMRLIPVTTLEGAVSLAGRGRDWPSNVSVSLYPATVGVVAPALLESPSRENGGRFRYGSVTPGTYFVVAETLSAGMASQMAADAPRREDPCPRVLTTCGQRTPL